MHPAGPMMELLEQVCEAADQATAGALHDESSPVDPPEICAVFQQGIWHVELGQASGSGITIEEAAAKTIVALATTSQLLLRLRSDRPVSN